MIMTEQRFHELLEGYGDGTLDETATKLLQDVPCHPDDLSIRKRGLCSHHFHIYLIKLTEPAFLRPFMPEHGTDGKELLHTPAHFHPVLDKGPDH